MIQINENQLANYILNQLQYNMKIELDQAPPTHFDFMIFWANLPLLFKVLLPFTYTLAIIGMFTELPVLWFANYAIKALCDGHIWRYFSAPYISLGMLHYTICMINMYYLLPRIQRTYSTSFAITDFFVQNFSVQLIFSLIIGVINDFTTYVQQFYSAGLWNILIIYLVRVCYAEPHAQIQMCCMPFKIRTVYYPFIMLVIFNIFTLPMIQVDIYISFIWAFIQVKCAKGNFFKYPPSMLLWIQARIVKLLGPRTDITKVSESSYSQYYSGKQQKDDLVVTQSAFNTIKSTVQIQDLSNDHVHSHDCDHTII